LYHLCRFFTKWGKHGKTDVTGITPLRPDHVITGSCSFGKTGLPADGAVGRGWVAGAVRIMEERAACFMVMGWDDDVATNTFPYLVTGSMCRSILRVPE
jgi:hypothetical protein